MPQLQDYTAGVPCRGPCLSHCIIFWQVDCTYGTCVHCDLQQHMARVN